MSSDRIGIRGEQYSRLNMKSLYESQLLESILENQDVLFPGYSAGKYAPLLESPWGAVRPDLVLVDTTHYQDWWLVEVEMSHHSLYWHVADQVEKLGRAEIDDNAIEALLNSVKNLDPKRAIDMAKSTPPSLLCIADHIPDDWRQAVPRDRVTWMEVEAFRSERGLIALRSRNQVAIRGSEIVGQLVPIRGLALVFTLNAGDKMPVVNPVQIEYRGVTSLWLADLSTRLVSPLGQIDIPLGVTFNIMKSGKLFRMEPTSTGEASK